MVIIGILAAIAYPSYRAAGDRRSNRTEAEGRAGADGAGAREVLYAACSTTSTALRTTRHASGRYAVTITLANTTQTAQRLTPLQATPQGPQAQRHDAELWPSPNRE